MMDELEIREYILGLPEAEETEPFEESGIVVYRVAGKWFAVYSFDRPGVFAVKCNPDRAVLLRDEFMDAIMPAWHFNKRHWNDMNVKALPEDVVKREICHSYLSAIKANVSPKALRERLLAIAAEAGIQDVSLPE